MLKHFLGCSFLLLSAVCFSQHIFETKLNNCVTDQFCLDCGDPKADPDPALLKRIANILNARYSFNTGKGRMAFQVLVDTAGRGCVLSHSGDAKNEIAGRIVEMLNGNSYQVASSKGTLQKSSINIVFEVIDNKIAGSVQRIPPRTASQNMNNPGKPVIYNQKYDYKNESLSHYNITVWQYGTSKLPNDMSITSAVEPSGRLWYPTYYGFAVLENDHITVLDSSNSPFKSGQRIWAVGVDAMENKWVSVEKGLFRYDNHNWEKVNDKPVDFTAAMSIASMKDSSVFFCTDTGLLILKNNHWTVINQQTLPQLPSNRVLYAFRDARRRLWIGTFGGSIMLDTEQKVTVFNDGKTPLKDICISGAAEDADGNLYFSLYSYARSKESNKPNEGFAVYTNNEEWKHYTHRNSGMPSNHVNAILYDRFENILWLGMNESGLVRFDLKKGFEVYHNQNSQIPSRYVFKLSQDNKGNLYASTFYGILRVKRKD